MRVTSLHMDYCSFFPPKISYVYKITFKKRGNILFLCVWRWKKQPATVWIWRRITKKPENVCRVNVEQLGAAGASPHMRVRGWATAFLLPAFLAHSEIISDSSAFNRSAVQTVWYFQTRWRGYLSAFLLIPDEFRKSGECARWRKSWSIPLK